MWYLWYYCSWFMNRLGYDVFSFGYIYRYGLYSEDVIYSGCYVEF